MWDFSNMKCGICGNYMLAEGTALRCTFCNPKTEEYVDIQAKITEIKEDYIKSYGCVSCWSDDHNCMCEHDKGIIERFYDTLVYKLTGNE